MLPVYSALASRLGRRRAWYAGLPIYWLVWCLAVPALILGPRGVARVLGRSRRDRAAVALAALPPLVAAAGGAAGWGTSSRREAILLAGTAVGNGFCEELLWRGVYATRYPDARRGVVWPALWFAFWHIAPGSMGDPRRRNSLVCGAAILGLTYGTVARRTGSIRWTVASHTLSGFAMTAVGLVMAPRARLLRGVSVSPLIGQLPDCHGPASTGTLRHGA
jgi:membrane protease YdiL (CAAX protease family)